MICIHCREKPVSKPHHIITKAQGGTDHPINLANLCFDCHFAIHHGIDSDLRIAAKKTCYEQIRGNLDLCWSGKIKPKVIRQLENEGYN